MSKVPRSRAAGFSLVELLMVVTVLAIVLGMAIPATLSMTERMNLDSATRAVERELQTARLKAVSINRSLQVRFNCPSAGRYRLVEVMRSSVDNTSGRCSESTYPLRNTRDTDATTPDYDGPVRYVSGGSSFAYSGLIVLQFAPDGRTTQITGSTELALPTTGLNIGLTKGPLSKTVNVNGLGRIVIQ